MGFGRITYKQNESNMKQKISVKDAKASLLSLIDKLNAFDENKEFVMEIDDNCGGSYRGGDIDKWQSWVSNSGEVVLYIE